jgi:hypothetical protein
MDTFTVSLCGSACKDRLLSGGRIKGDDMSKETGLGGLQSSDEATIFGRADVCKP